MNSRVRVLVVDDDPAVRTAVGRVLGSTEFEVSTASDAREAERLLRSRDFDAALLDLALPGTGGLALAASIRARPETARLPILFLTGDDRIESIEAAFGAGGEDYIVKPPRPRELVSRVRAATDRYRMIRDLDDAESVLLSIARAVEAKDGETGDHCDRLSRLSVALGRRLGLPDADLAALRKAGVLHDIGKIAIPDAILKKPGRLDDAEREVMKTHAAIGAELVRPLRTMSRTLPIVRHHHERLDGSGYPDGLAGDAIPPLARVFQVCDVYDALVSVRPYKSALSRNAALAILREEAAKGWWDSQIVEEFADVVRRK